MRYQAPIAHGWEDQRWTLARVKTVIGRRFHLTYTIQGVRKLLAVMAGPAGSRLDARSGGTTTRWPGGSKGGWVIYRPRRDDGNRDGRKSFSWRDYRDLLIRAHQQFSGPIVLVWDNLNVHKAADLREWVEAQDWLTIYHLPSYSPDLNPVERIWSLLRRGWLSNVAFSIPEHLI